MLLDIQTAIPLFSLTGVACFILGAIYQQDVSYRKIIKLIQMDPYVYRCRHSLFGVLSLFGNDTRSDAKPKTKIYTLMQCWLRNRIYNMFSLFSLRNEQSTTTRTVQLTNTMKYGFPGMDDLHVFDDFVLSYDRRNHTPHWICEHLTAHKIRHQSTKSNALLVYASNEMLTKIDDTISQCDFDDDLNPPNGNSDEDLQKLTTKSVKSTGIKSKSWRRLENHVRKLTQQFGSVFTYTGPMYMPKRVKLRSWALRYQVVGLNVVAEPTHYFKVILVESKCLKSLPYMEGYVVPNTKIEDDVLLSSFLCDISDIEVFSGLKFYDGLRRKQFYETLGSKIQI